MVRQVNIPVIANGDITSADKAKQVLEYTGASRVMAGRATQGNPWLIHEIVHFLKTGQHAQTVPLELKKQVILSHIQQFYGDFLGLRLARKHIFWYATHLDRKYAQQFWQSVNRINNQKQQFNLLENYLQQL